MPAPSLGEARRRVHVYLPAEYGREEAAARRYPVVTLLHGWPGADGDWFTQAKAHAIADALIARGEIPPVILVCPNGNARGLWMRTIYMNAQRGATRMEDYVARDLVAWTDATFRTRTTPGGRAVIGISDGATAAFNLVIRHPDVFGAAGGHSGCFRLRREFSAFAILGCGPGASRLLAEHSPALTAAGAAGRLRAIPLYFDCGAGDPEAADNRAFHETLTGLGVPHAYHEFPGAHTWSYWSTHLPRSLKAIAGAMR